MPQNKNNHSHSSKHVQPKKSRQIYVPKSSAKPAEVTNKGNLQTKPIVSFIKKEPAPYRPPLYRTPKPYKPPMHPINNSTPQTAPTFSANITKPKPYWPFSPNVNHANSQDAPATALTTYKTPSYQPPLYSNSERYFIDSIFAPQSTHPVFLQPQIINDKKTSIIAHRFI